MKQVTGDFWKMARYADAICVTTNGIIKNNGELVMGKGIALQFAQRYPGLALKLAAHVSRSGNTPCLVAFDLPDQCDLVLSFPTKHNWVNPSSLELIIDSAKLVVEIANDINLKKILLTRPGCGNGGLDWHRQVEPAIRDILDNRFVVVTPNTGTGTVACI